MSQHRYQLQVAHNDYDYHDTDRFEANNRYAVVIRLAPRVAYEPAEPARSYRRGNSISTTTMFMMGPRPDPNEIIRVPAKPARWYAVGCGWDEAVLIDWLHRTVELWTERDGWEPAVPLDAWIRAGGWAP